MITGAHVIFYSTDPEKDRIFLRDIMKFPNVDAGGGMVNFRITTCRSGHSSFRSE